MKVLIGDLADDNCQAARIASEGHILEDAETVVKSKAREWTGTGQAKYLRPCTLFGPKFDRYLQAARNGQGDINAAFPRPA